MPIVIDHFETLPPAADQRPDAPADPARPAPATAAADPDRLLQLLERRHERLMRLSAD